MKYLICAAFMLCMLRAGAQSIVTKWSRNTTGKKGSYWANNGGMPPTYTYTISTDSADVLKVAYTTDSVWVRCNGLTDSMGKYLNPGTCLAQSYIYRFPRIPSVGATKTTSPKGGAIGLLLNGIPVFGLSNSYSYTGSANAPNGSGIWNVEVGKSEGFVLDTNYGAHPQQAGAYHSHDKPYRMYRDYATNVHSPLIGYAFDGYPIYGPYGYSTAMNASSAVTRMKTGYSLRNITTRTKLPYNVTPTQTGPAVSTTYPLGTYCEDYEWLASNSGDLDKYNGRTCVTPEYPSGTYAYFVTIDAAGVAAFPYYIGIEYYGQPVTSDIAGTAGSNGTGLSIPVAATTYNGVPLALRLLHFWGEASGASNRLAWSIAKTVPLQRIELERSTDGAHFTVLADIMPEREEDADYAYADKAPMAQSFYRIKMTEVGGVVTYSAIVALRHTLNNGLLVYPTLASDFINITGANTAAATMVIIKDALGYTVQSVLLNAAEPNASIDISKLAVGLYIVQAGYNGAGGTAKFFKR